ncbi:MAG: acyl-CoA thioesterase domain-containing protein [Acidimicrobiia bacterium]
MSAFDDPDAGRSVTRYLGVTLREQDDEGIIVGTAPAASHLVDPSGIAHAGVLLGMIDSAGGVCAGLASLPRWIVSTNLVGRLVPRSLEGGIVLRARVLRAGRNSVVTSIDARDDATDALLADVVLTSAVLEPDGGPPSYDRPMVLAVPPATKALPDPDSFYGVRPAAAGVELALTDTVRNPWGILHGGVTTTLVESAVRHTLAGAGLTSVVLHFLRPGRVGPVRTVATRIGSRPDGELLRVEARDLGADSRTMAIAIVTATRGGTES